MEKYIKPRGSVMEERLRMAGLDEKIDEGKLQWFGHVESDRNSKRVYVGEYADSRSVGHRRDGLIL